MSRRVTAVVLCSGLFGQQWSNVCVCLSIKYPKTIIMPDQDLSQLSRSSSSSSDGKRRRRRRPDQCQERTRLSSSNTQRLSSSDTQMEYGRRRSQSQGQNSDRKNVRKRKSMSDYFGKYSVSNPVKGQLFLTINSTYVLDFKSHDNRSKIENSETRIPVVVKDVNLNAADKKETKDMKCKDPARRKLSAETIMNAIQKRASTLSTNWKISSSKRKSSPDPSSSDSQLEDVSIKVTNNDENNQPDRRKLTLPVKKLTTIPSVDYQVRGCTLDCQSMPF